MTRALLYCLTPYQGKVGEHVPYLIAALRQRYGHIAVSLNGPLSADQVEQLSPLADRILPGPAAESQNEVYAAALGRMGRDSVKGFDELTLMSCDLFGPVLPIEALFSAMDADDGADDGADVWALAEAAPLTAPPPLAGSTAAQYYEPLEIPVYLDQSLLTFRKRLLQSEDFVTLWSADLPSALTDRMPRHDQEKAVDQARFLASRGYRSAAYLKLADFLTTQPLYLEMQSALRKKALPFLRFDPFCRSALYQDDSPANLNQVLPLLARLSDFPQRLFWQTALRRASLRTLHTNLAYQFTFDSTSYSTPSQPRPTPRIAVCAHVYYPDVLPEILERTRNIPTAYDIFITTASQANKTVIEAMCAEAGLGPDTKIDVRVVGQNRGRDMASLYIDLKDVIIDGGYDLICRLHSKRSPQVNASTGTYFKHYIFDAVLASPAYTAHLLDFLVANPHVGMAFAPMIHTGYATMGNGWFENRPVFAKIMEHLGCEAPHEPYSPIAAYGTVYWFRPDALRPLFEDHYRYEDYNAEPNHLDGGLAHGLERAMTYIAQSRGYMSATVWPDYVAAQSTTLMEYKMDTLYSTFRSGRTAPHSHLMRLMSAAPGNVVAVPAVVFPKSFSFLKSFEKRHRPLIKKVGRKLGLVKPRKK